MTVLDIMRKENLLHPTSDVVYDRTLHSSNGKYRGEYLGLTLRKPSEAVKNVRCKVRCSTYVFTTRDGRDISMSNVWVPGVLTSTPCDYKGNITLGFQPDDPNLRLTGCLWYGYVLSFTPALKPRKQKT